jgi:hypothetical protein
MAGPQAGPVRFYYANLQPIIKRLQDLEKNLVDVDMSEAVQGAGKVWKANFENEGRDVGGWRELSEFTQNLREWRGYDASHPIMQQSGALYRAVAWPATFKGDSGNITTPPTPMGGGGPTTASIEKYKSRVGTKAELTISGDKVSNHYGGENIGVGWTGSHGYRLPRRPFWYVDDRVEQAVKEAVMEQIGKELDKLV